ncbi:MAG: DUF4091 domain-containing protein, partial [Terriglobia bacterium]
MSIQLAIRSGRALANLTAKVAPLVGPAGNEITGLQVHYVGDVVVGSHTPDSPANELVGVAPGLYPDPLLDFPLDLKARWTTPIWVSIHIPADAQVGIYRDKIEVMAGGNEIAHEGFRLNVMPASVPEARTLKLTNWFSLDDKTSRQFYGVAMFSPQWWTLVENVGRVLADYRQNVIFTPLMDLIQPHVEGGKLTYDYTNFDRWVETFKGVGAIGYIEGSHLTTRAAGSYNGALLVPTFQIVSPANKQNCPVSATLAVPVPSTNGEVVRISLPAGDPRVEPFLTNFLSALYAHLKEKGWADIYLQHISDEAHGPEIPHYAKLGEIVHRTMPGVPTIDAVDASNMPEELAKNCDIWVPQLGRFDNYMKMIEDRLHSGRAVWYYTCLYPQGRYPNRLMDFPLIKTRLLPWIDFRFGFTGFLHWGGNSWTPEPMLDTQPVIDDNSTLLPPGDAFILYPDRAHLTVLTSIRLEALRAGIEDYEMLHQLEARNPDAARQIAGSAISSFTDYVRDAVQF